MTYGLVAHNDNGDVLIDGIFQNHVIAESGSVSTTHSSGSGIYGPETVNFASTYNADQQPLVFVRSTGPYIALRYFKYPIDDTTVNGFFYFASAATIAFDWKLVITPSGASADTEGIRVFDDAGTVVFDSGLDYLPIVDAVSITPSTAPSTFAHVSATTPFYCLTSGYALKVDAGTNAYYLGYKASTSTAGAFDWCKEDIVPAGTFIIPSSCTVLVGDAG